GLTNAGTVTMHNTLVAGNFQGTGFTRSDVLGDVASASSHNLIGDGTGLSGIGNNINDNLIGSAAFPIDPLLRPLQDNGGPTLTHATLRGSPAHELGDAAVGLPATDQRGFSRVVGVAPDIGAFEYQYPKAVTELSASLNPVEAGQPVSLTALVFGQHPGSNP